MPCTRPFIGSRGDECDAVAFVEVWRSGCPLDEVVAVSISMTSRLLASLNGSK